MIETERLILRINTLADFEPFAAMYGDAAVLRHIGDGKPASRQDSWFRMQRFVGHWSLLGYGLFAIIEKSTGRFIGQTGLADFQRGLGDDFDPYPEAAWVFVAEAHGKGYASEAAKAAHDWFAREHGAQRTVCIIDPDNAGSIRVAEKLGYRSLGQRTFRGDDKVIVFEKLP